jgi:hypothetical protein
MNQNLSQRGGMIGLLLSLLAIGAVLYFVLHGGSGAGPASDATMVNCERAIADLVAKTGGLGEAYATGYAKLPPSCQKLTPAPGALEPSAAKLPES